MKSSKIYMLFVVYHIVTLKARKKWAIINAS